MDDQELKTEYDLVTWVLSKVDEWSNDYETNFKEKHLEYDRIWRGIWAYNDRTRESERSKLVSPATAQAVESSVAEVEEAIFGRGEVVDIRDDDQDPSDVVAMRQNLMTEFKKRKFRRHCSEVLINAAVTGTGIAELVLDEIEETTPATQQVDPMTNAVGVQSKDKVVVKYRSIHPKNFRIDPVACSIEEALGVAIEEYVPLHQVEQLQEAGIYRDDVVVGTADYDTDLIPDQMLHSLPRTKCKLVKYYGLVPRELLEADEDPEGEDPLDGLGFDVEEDVKEQYVEAIVVIESTSGELLKAEKNPFMMKQRPVVAFQWDIVPGRFWGRGVVEKAYNSQKAIDAELRARADALALTAHPMLAVDATRLPRGMNAKIVPGKTLLTSGNPNEVLRPFNFGEVSQITFAQAEALQRMLQQATGAVDTGGMPTEVGQARSGAVSMSLSGIIKRHKRTLINFQEDFLIPVVEKSAWMLMQYDPDNYPARDYSFIVCGSLGIMAREYETSLLTTLLGQTDKESPIYLDLVKAVIENMHISEREAFTQAIEQAKQPDPAAIEAQQRQAQLQEQLLQSQISAFNAQANEANKRAEKYEYEKRAIPVELENDRIKAIATNITEGNSDDKEFERRWKAANLMLQERKVDLEEAKTLTQIGQSPSGNPTGGLNGTTGQQGRFTRSS